MRSPEPDPIRISTANGDLISASTACPLSRNGGFSLIEVVVATILVMLVVFSLGVLIPLSQVRSRNISHQDVAVMLAESMIEKIRVLGWDRIAPVDKTVGVSKEFDGKKGDDPVMINGSRFPPLPYPKMSYELMAGEVSPGSAVKTDVKHYMDYFYRVRTQSYAVPYPDSSTATYTSKSMLKVTVAVYWSESTGEGGSHEKCFSISSSIYGEQ